METMPAAASGRVPLGQLPAHHAGRDPQRPMLTVGDVTVSRSAFEAAANRRARGIAKEGVVSGDLVAVSLGNGIEFYETSFALWKLGATPLIVSPALPSIELGAIVQLADPALVIGPRSAELPGRRSLAAGTLDTSGLSSEALPVAVPRYWKAITSGGSTGRPKIIVDHLSPVWDPTAPLSLQQVDDTLLNPGPLYHNAPFFFMHAGLFVGAHVVDIQKFDAQRALELIDRHRVGWTNLLPTMMNRIWRLPLETRSRFDLSALRVVMHMAAPCPMWLKRNWIEWLGPQQIYELYAGTERTGRTLISGSEWLEHPGSVGRPQRGTDMMIVNAQGQRCAPMEVGEIFFLPDGGRGSTYHYLGAEAQRFGEWESLGDLGYLDEDGYLYLADRRTDLIIAGGANVYPAEVEAALEAHPEVEQAVVVGLPDNDLGQRVHAVVQRGDGSTLTDVALIEFAAERLVRYKLPRSIEFVAVPLRDDAGKVRRAALASRRAGEY